MTARAAFVACGLIAWRRRPDSFSGLLMTATGFLLFVEPLAAQFSSHEAEVLGDLLEDLWSIPLAWLLLTMLSGGRLRDRAGAARVGGVHRDRVRDGVGGADAARGSGLRGHADRVEALEGRLTVVSPPGEGTIVTAELPHSTSAAGSVRLVPSGS